MLSVVIPHRNREKNLKVLLGRLHDCLTDFECLVIEQRGDKPFNRGMLMNIGFLLSCGDQVCYHDADMLPVEFDYSPVSTPTCLITSCNLYGDSIPYASYFGGVTLFSRLNSEKVNGFSNRYFSWGKEDDDMWLRCHNVGLPPERRPGIFYHQEHPREHCHTHNSNNEELLAEFRRNPELQWGDGLQSVAYTMHARRTSGAVHFVNVEL